MRALFFDQTLSLIELPTPKPGENEVLIRVLYSAICNTDIELTRGYMQFKGIPGHEFVGEVVTKGSFLYGKRVVGEINCSCDDCYLCQTGRRTHCPNRTVLGIDGHAGVFADYITLPEQNLHEVPQGLEPTRAVFTEPLAAAIEIFEQVQIKPSQNVFIFGAGKLGMLISQVFRLNGCDYTTFDTNDGKVLKARKLGLNAKPMSALSEGQRAEVCVDCTGNPGGIKLAMNHLFPRGRLVLKTTVANPDKIDLNQVVINEYEIIGSRCGMFEPAISLLGQGLVNPEPLISKIFDFSQILEAFAFAEQPGTLKVLIKH